MAGARAKKIVELALRQDCSPQGPGNDTSSDDEDDDRSQLPTESPCHSVNEEAFQIFNNGLGAARSGHRRQLFTENTHGTPNSDGQGGSKSINGAEKGNALLGGLLMPVKRKVPEKSYGGIGKNAATGFQKGGESKPNARRRLNLEKPGTRLPVIPSAAKVASETFLNGNSPARGQSEPAADVTFLLDGPLPILSQEISVEDGGFISQIVHVEKTLEQAPKSPHTAGHEISADTSKRTTSECDTSERTPSSPNLQATGIVPFSEQVPQIHDNFFDCNLEVIVETVEATEYEENNTNEAEAPSTPDQPEQLQEEPHEQEQQHVRIHRPLRSPTRKRTRNESLWKRTVAKRLKNAGQPYINSRGAECPGPKMRDPCSCTWNCRHKVKPEERQIIFNTFWALGDHNRQWEFIRTNSNSKATVPQPGQQALKRKVARTYKFDINKESVKVCKQMFMRTLDICDSWIDSAYNHVNADKGNTVSPDKRGGHRKGVVTALTDEKIASVKEHVNLFPRIPSHYCRKRTKREYLERGLSISKMARMYKKLCVEKKLPKTSIATKRQYRDILNSNFNIGFYKPKKDQCAFCCIMRNKSNPRAVREARKEAWVVHLNNKTVSRAMKRKDKRQGEKNKSIAVVSFDLQKQLTCPQSESSAMYYKRKLNVYNFTAFNMVEREGICFLWHEGMGKKGSSEICSALLILIEELVRLGYKIIIFWSDNCGGQNKNRYLFAMYEYLAVKFGIEIRHRYLEPGHTQMEVDSIHANIEKSVEKKDIFDFDGWIEAIEESKVELPPYKVRTLATNDIFSFKSLVSKQNWDVDMKGSKIAWSKVKEIYVNGSEGNMVRIKYDLNQEEYVTMSPNKRGHPINLKTFQPPHAYTGRLPLSQEKIEDLLWLCENLHVPLNKQAFLRDLISEVDPVDGEDVSDIEYDSGEDSENEDWRPASDEEDSQDEDDEDDDDE